MSLLVHLPLRGDLKNRGIINLDLVKTTNSDISYVNNGKLGKALHVELSKALVGQDTDRKLCLTDNFSFCFWLNAHFLNTNINLDAFTVGRVRGTGSSYGYGLRIASTTSWVIQFGDLSYTIASTDNTWTHIVFTKSGNTIKIYKNNTLYNTYTFSGTLPTFSTAQYNGLGLGCYNWKGEIPSNYANVEFNDFRIYNHVLSIKEIKTIYLSLILYYPLKTSFSTPLYSNTAEINIINDNTDYNSERFAVIAGLKYHVFVEVKSSTNINNNLCILIQYATSINGTRTTYTWLPLNTTTEYLIHHVIFTVPNGLTYCFIGYRSLNSISGTSTLLKNVYIYGGIGTKVYDCSGYENHGTKKGNVYIYPNSCKHTESAYFNSGNIEVDCYYHPTHDFTVAGCINSSSIPSDGYILNNLLDGGIALTVSAKNGFRFSVYVNGYKRAATTALTGWHHLCGTYDKNNIKLYVDGLLSATTALTGNVTHHSTTPYAIGANPTGSGTGSSGMSGVYVSDVRMYATALTASDVSDLYNTSAYIDNLGLLSAYEFIEGNTDSKIENDGRCITKNLYESLLTKNYYLLSPLSTNWYTPPNVNNACCVYYKVNLENIIPDKRYVIELDLYWSGPWAFENENGGYPTRFLGTNYNLSGTAVWSGTNYLVNTLNATGGWPGYKFTKSESGSYHYKGYFKIPSSWFLSYKASLIGTRSDYSTGTGSFLLTNLKIYPVDIDTVDNNAKLDDDYITTNLFIEI